MVRFVVVAVALWLALPWGGCVPIPAGRTDRVGRLKDAAKIASATAAAVLLARKLAKIESEFRQRRQRLTVISAGTESEAYRAKEVESLVDSSEENVFEALAGKELAALRDSVRLRFRRIHQGLQTSAQISQHEPMSAFQTGIRLAAFRPSRNGTDGLLRRKSADPFLNDLGSMLLTLLGFANDDRFTLRLCVISRPAPQASFHMWPPSYKKGDFGGETIRDIPRAQIGRYFYKVQYKQRALKKQFEPIECGGEDEPCLDFMQSTGDQLIECDFSAGSCRASDLPSGRCPPR